MEAPRIQDMYEEYQDQGVQVLAIGYHESIQSCIEWKNRHFLTHPVMSDPTGVVTLQYVPNAGGVWLPHCVIVDTNHVVQYTERGFEDTTIYRILDSLLIPELFVNPDHLELDTVGIGSISRKYFSIKNNGLGILDITDITTSHPDFTVFPSTGEVFPYQDSLIVGVTFSPTQTVQYVDTLWVFSSAGEAIVTLSGTGVSSDIHDLTIGQVDSTSIQLRWGPIWGANGYYIYTDSVPDVELIIPNFLTYSSDTTFLDTLILEQNIGARYYRVTAIFLRQQDAQHLTPINHYERHRPEQSDERPAGNIVPAGRIGN